MWFHKTRYAVNLLQQLVCIYSAESSQDKGETGVFKLLTGSLKHHRDPLGRIVALIITQIKITRGGETMSSCVTCPSLARPGGRR